MTSESQIIKELKPFIREITDLPLPSIPGAHGKFYLEIQQIRVEGISEICSKLLARTQHKHGYQSAAELRREFDSIRLDLLAIYPECAALLEADSWPDAGSIH